MSLHQIPRLVLTLLPVEFVHALVAAQARPASPCHCGFRLAFVSNHYRDYLVQLVLQEHHTLLGGFSINLLADELAYLLHSIVNFFYPLPNVLFGFSYIDGLLELLEVVVNFVAKITKFLF